MSASNPENWDSSWHIPILEEHNACPLFTIVVTEISAICYKQEYLKPVLQYVLLCAINFEAICSLLGGTCIILIISWLRTAFDFTLRFSFIAFWAHLLLLWSSALRCLWFSHCCRHHWCRCSRYPTSVPGVAIPAEDGVGRDMAMAAAPAAKAAGVLGPASERAGLCHGPAAFRTAGEG